MSESWTLVTFAILVLLTIVKVSSPSEQVYTQCGGTLRGETRGVISTPNFPGPYPVPIRCRWVIEAPEDKVIVVYFTQFYMREGLEAAEYAYYSDAFHMGMTDFGIISSDREPTYLISNKPVLVLEFNVKDVSNIHMRVREFFLDVFGFNVTFEVIGKNESVRNDSCIYHHCTFTGNCFTSDKFQRYYCSCFEDYYGSECQYDQRCGPSEVNDMCQNGGTCRYYIGSAVRTCECPSGYEGVWCEKEQKDSFREGQCSALGCSQTCTKSTTNAYSCSCYLGYKLSDDQKTCIHTGRTRYLVSFRLYDWNVDLLRFGVKRHRELKKGIESALLTLFQARLSRVENLTVLNFQADAVVQFHLFGNMDDSEQARQVMEEALRRGKIGNYSVDRSFIRFEWEPGLSIHKLESSESMPIVEGSELSLACVVQGSSAMEVAWYKDGAPINVKTTYRGMWTSIVPKNSKKQYTALLGFDTSTILDSGLFMCQVSDWGLVQNKSIEVTILSVPKPQVTPMTSTVHEGDKLIITCLSHNDIYGNFGYNWLKNGQILNPLTEPEMIEDLFPAGSRIILPSAITSSVYTCIITSNAGATRKDSVITVINKGRRIITCRSEDYLIVKWTETAANSEDIQHCPPGYTGDVKRLCLLHHKDNATWEEPDFSGCLSSEFMVISRKFESLKMGYLISNVSLILDELKMYLMKKKESLHVSEGVPVVDLLDTIQEYEHKNIKDEESVRSNAQVFLDIVSFLLTIPHLIQKQSHLIKLHHLLLNYGLLHGSLVESENFLTFERSTLVMEVGKIRKEKTMNLRFPKYKVGENRSRTENSSVPAVEPLRASPTWLTDSLELDIGTWLVKDYVDDNDSLTVAVIFYKNLSIFLPKLFLSHKGGLDLEYHLHSRLVAVAVKGRQAIPGTQQKNLKVRARLTHLNHSLNSGFLWNISCGVADFSHGKMEFAVEGCEPVLSGNHTLCQCTQLGTYAVLLTTFLQNGGQLGGTGFEMIAGLGCVVCAFLVCLTLLILVVFWRQIQGAITALKIQVCISLLGAYGTMLKALHESLTEAHYPHVISVIQFFLLAAFCMQLCLGLTVYIEFVDMRNVRYPELKIAAIGWAFPLIVVGATLAAQVLEGFRIQSWWLKFETNYFYAYVTSVFIVSLLQILLFLTVKAELRRHEKLAPHRRNIARNRARLLHRSLVVLIFLLLVSVSSILYINFEDDIFKYIFAVSSGVLGLVVFLSYTLLSENIHRMCFTCSKAEPDLEEYEHKMRSRSNSYKTFLKPEIVGDTQYCRDFEGSLSIEQRKDRITRMRSQLETTANHRDWKGADHALLGGGDRTSAAEQASGGPQRGKKNPSDHLRQQQQHAWHCPHSKSGTFPPLELQELEGSPRSSHLYLVDPAGGGSSPYDISPTAEGATIVGGYLPHAGCQLHRTLGHSDVSESESSYSSGTEDSALVHGTRAAGFVPYRPSSILQFERGAISEEDENEADKMDNHPLFNGTDQVRIGSAGDGGRSGKRGCDDNGNPLVYQRDRPAPPLRTGGSCSTDCDSSEMEMPTSHEEDPTQSKKSWSITTV